jgi:hypothetical protein
MAGGAAEAQSVVWQGKTMLERVSTACISHPDIQRRVLKGSLYRSVFRPANLQAGNGPDHRLMMINLRTASTIRLTNATLPNGSYTGQQINSLGRTFGISGTYSNVVIVPANITTNTPTVAIAGIIDNFVGISGCTVNFRSALTRRP